jgi:hypothetical protein
MSKQSQSQSKSKSIDYDNEIRKLKKQIDLLESKKYTSSYTNMLGELNDVINCEKPTKSRKLNWHLKLKQTDNNFEEYQTIAANSFAPVYYQLKEVIKTKENIKWLFASKHTEQNLEQYKLKAKSQSDNLHKELINKLSAKKPSAKVLATKPSAKKTKKQI